MPKLRSESNGICKDIAPANVFRDELVLSHVQDTLCIVGTAHQSRASSSVEMLRRAMELLHKQGRALPSFCGLRFSLRDTPGREHTFGYNGRAKFLVPDYSFLHWREAGHCPDYETVTKRLRELGTRPPKIQKCGWVGSVVGFTRVVILNASLEFPDLLEAIWPRESEGRAPGRMTMEQQVERYACLLDARGDSNGYSPRVPMLLHTGRPVIYTKRSRETYMDTTFYNHLPEKLIPGQHFVPLERDRDLAKQIRWILDPENAEKVRSISQEAQRFAQKYLTLDAAIAYLADVLIQAAKNISAKEACQQSR